MMEWISCKERMPEKYGKYLVTIEGRDGNRFVRMAEWEFDIVKCIEDIDNVKGKFYVSAVGIYYDEDDNCPDDQVFYDNVIAWMPLPEAYKGE